MIRKITFFLIFIFISSIALAVDFEGHKYSGDEFTVGDDEFLIRLSNDEELLSFKSDLESVTVKKGKCESTQYYKYCFNHTVVDFSEDLGKLHDYTGELMPAIKIMMTNLKADLKVIKTIIPEKPNEYEPVYIIVNITNKGKKLAHIKYTENVSNPAEVYNCKSCTIINNEILYIATIYPSDEKIISYYLNPKDMEEVILVPTLNYETDISNGTTPLDNVKITPKKSFVITYTGNKEPVIEDVERSTLSFENNDPSNKIIFTSTIIFDEDIIFTSSDSDVETEGNKLIFSGTLDPSEVKEFSINVLGKISGKKKVVLFNDYKLGSDKVKSNTSLDFEIKIEKPTFELLITDNIYSDRLQEIEFNIDNSGSKNSFKDMNIQIQIPETMQETSSSKTYVIDETFIIPFLKFSRQLNAYKKNFIMSSEIKKTIEAKIVIDYKTVYDELLSETISKKIILNPMEDIVTIEHSIEDYKQEEGSLLISTFLKNNDGETLISNVSEKINGAKILTLDAREIGDYTKLTKSDYFYVTSLSKKQAFSYMLKKEENNTANMLSEVVIEGTTNIYKIIFYSIIDFEKKTITLENTSVEIISEAKEVKFNDTGILTENIELEKTHIYDSTDEEVISKDNTEPNNTFDVSTNVEGETEEKQKEIIKKKTFWDKIKDIFSVFF